MRVASFGFAERTSSSAIEAKLEATDVRMLRAREDFHAG